MIARILYTLKMAWLYRKPLQEIRLNPAFQSKTVLDLDFPLLKRQGIKICALDVDGVLVPYGEIVLEENMAAWLRRSIQEWGAENLYIYTNRPGKDRKEYFSQHFPGIGFVEVLRKKPYPDGLYQIMQKTEIKAKEILVVDDRLLTGILAAVIVGSQVKWITDPLISFRKRPLAELFFIMLRTLERFILR